MAESPEWGPHATPPTTDVPPWKGNATSKRWLQVRNGDWYAFYLKEVGPDAPRWNIEHHNDPHWWSDSATNTTWYCIHGQLPNQCPLPDYCGFGPSDVSSDQVTAAVRGLRKILNGEITEAADSGISIGGGDLRTVTKMIEFLGKAVRTEDAYVSGATLIVRSKQEYQIGTLRYDGNDWQFTPHEESEPAT